MQWRKVDSSKLLLTLEEEIEVLSITRSRSDEDQKTGLLVVQSLKIIQEFVDSGVYNHKEWRGLAMHGDWECAPDCPVCELQRDITKDHPELRKFIKRETGH